jgi:hypothetical protein
MWSLYSLTCALQLPDVLNPPTIRRRPHGGRRRAPPPDRQPQPGPCPTLHKLAAFLSDDDIDEFDKNALARAAGAAETLVSVLRRPRGCLR